MRLPISHPGLAVHSSLAKTDYLNRKEGSEVEAQESQKRGLARLRVSGRRCAAFSIGRSRPLLVHRRMELFRGERLAVKQLQ